MVIVIEAMNLQSCLFVFFYSAAQGLIDISYLRIIYAKNIPNFSIHDKLKLCNNKQ